MIELTFDWTKISKSERRLIAELAVELAERLCWYAQEVQIDTPKGHFYNEGHSPFENSEALLYDLDVCCSAGRNLIKPLPSEEIRKVIMEKATPGPSVKQVLANYIWFRSEYLSELLPTCKGLFTPPLVYSKVIDALEAEGYVAKVRAKLDWKKNAYNIAMKLLRSGDDFQSKWTGYQWTDKIAPVMCAIAKWGHLPTREQNLAKVTHGDTKEFLENGYGLYTMPCLDPYIQAKISTYEEFIVGLKRSFSRRLSAYPPEEQDLILKEIYEYCRDSQTPRP